MLIIQTTGWVCHLKIISKLENVYYYKVEVFFGFTEKLNSGRRLESFKPQLECDGSWLVSPPALDLGNLVNVM